MLHISALRGMLVADTTYKMFGTSEEEEGGRDGGGRGGQQLLSSELVHVWEALICK